MPKILHTGGAAGADYAFAKHALEASMTTKIHSFEKHNAKLIGLNGYERINHSKQELAKEAFPAYEQANKVLNRAFPYKEYVRNLILRDYFQIISSEYVFAVAPLLTQKIVSGGTGYAVQMAIDRNLPVVLFDDNQSYQWHFYSYKEKRFIPIDHNPPNGFLTALEKESITGIGTRKLSQKGEDAIAILFGHKKGGL